MSSRLEVKNLTRTFKVSNKEFLAVDNINFSLNESEIVSIIGPNGAGKTTTVQMITGYLQQTSGEVIINNKIQMYPKISKSKEIGVVFGGELGFYSSATAYDNLTFFSNLAGLKRSIIKSEVDRVLDVVDLIDVKHKKVGEFSRGMRQRLHIARALLGNPATLVLDEPTTGLDVEIANEIRKVILDLRDTGVSVLLTSHTMSEIEKLSDRVIIIGSGKIFYDGSLSGIIDLANQTCEIKVNNLEDAYLHLAPLLKRVV